MYDKRIKIFVVLGAVLLSVFLFRLARLQLAPDYEISGKIAELKRQQGRSRQLKTLRGKIIDRNGKILAVDEPVFELYISYRLSSTLDDRLSRAKLLLAETGSDPQKAIKKTIQELQDSSEILRQVIEKSAHFGPSRSEQEETIRKRNDQIWNLRLFQAWRKNCTQTALYKQYGNDLLAVKLSEFTADFENSFPDPNGRLIKIAGTDIAEMREDLPLLQLKTDDDVITAEIEFMNIEAVKIMPRSQRTYPFGLAAAQTIGWVSLPQEKDIQFFADDRYSRYLSGEVSGRDGVEFVCETTLRGKRGEIYYDADGNEVRLETEFGKDVRLTLDIELQSRIEKYMTQYNLPADAGPGMSAVIIDVPSGQILALVSLPTFDLNRVRNDYTALGSDANEPMRNRAINQLYPPGSSVKPLILIAGLQSGAITPQETIDCSPHRPPQGWPQCWISRQYPGRSHGPVNARNAIKHSCNIYFSHLADRIDPAVLQRWLFNFGYGRRILPPPSADPDTEAVRNFTQAGGIISSSRPTEIIEHPEPAFGGPPLTEGERRYFGIGQGSLRTTPLQAANAMASIARGGLYLPPRLFIEDNNDTKIEPESLGISQTSLDTVYDGMRAVVNEPEGTAYNAFSHRRFSGSGITIYGKTGSTENPEHAWFAGFVKDNSGRSIALAVLVEGGKSGANVAAPLAADIISFCIEARCIGNNPK
jgi:penicillin-binding protein 2